ncbi:uncharacterized protein LOC124174051 [Ischnura elegans]|uniref:uncharacterized protein LOC124174051 n=1 Tax=Ischnura elegans TaxID=197161 RepID=UPI001ED88694|nr:uncharacterized protein LOC124174051 [Ischnura elegans]
MKQQFWPLITLLLTATLKSSRSQVFSVGQCPTTLTSTSTELLTFTNLVGTWREIARTPFTERHSWTCVTYTVAVVVGGTSYSLTITGKNKLTLTTMTNTGTITVGGTPASMTGMAATAAEATTYLIFSVNNGITTQTLNYYIRYVDNADPTVMILYACENVLFGYKEYVLILAKDTLTGTALQTAYSYAGYPKGSLSFNFKQDCY